MLCDPPHPRLNRCSRWLATALVACTLGGCQTAAKLPVMTAFGDDTSAAVTVRAADLPHAELIASGKTYYLARDFGNAQVVYQKAVEIYPRNAEAWLGLAASYDQLRRFDQADLAYRKVHQLDGPSSPLFNNRGFHLLLRGKPRDAARLFHRALALDPDNDVARNNLNLIRRLIEEQQMSPG